MKSLERNYKWKHLTIDGEIEDVKPFREYNNKNTYLRDNFGYTTKDDAYNALEDFITEESQYSYNEFILVETFRVCFD